MNSIIINFFNSLSFRLMLKEDINNLPLPELMELLVKSTTELLEVMHKKDANKIIIRNLRIELQMIQSAIENKKTNKLYRVS